MRGLPPSIVVLAAALGTGARAEPAPPRPVSLAEVLAALPATPGWRAAGQRTSAAVSDLGAAAAWPALTVGAATTAHTPRAVLTLSVPLPVFGTVGAARDVARAELSLARADEGAALLDLKRRAIAAWIELARAEAAAAVSAEIAAGESRLAEVAQRRADAGDASHAEVVAAGASAARARADDAAARAEVLTASASLAAELGWDPAAPLTAVPGLPDPTLPPADGDVEHHPELRAALARVAREVARVAQAHRARFPSLGVDLEAAFDDPTLPGNDYRAGITLDLPLLGHGGDAERAARFRQSVAELEREQTKRVLHARLVVARQRYEAAAARAGTLAREVLPAQRDAARLAQAAYREGQGRLVEVIAANRALADAELEAVAARAAAAAARLELEQASGW